MLCALQPVAPLLESQLDGEEFSVPHIVFLSAGDNFLKKAQSCDLECVPIR